MPSYLQELGELAKSGVSLFAKQSLVDLITPTTLEITPNYWAALIWKRLMGTAVYVASTGGDRLTRVYVHGGAKGTDGAASWAMCLINLGANATIMAGLPTECSSRAVYALTSPAANATSPTVLLNGRALRLSTGGAVPQISPHVEECVSRLVLPPLSATFVVMAAGNELPNAAEARNFWGQKPKAKRLLKTDDGLDTRTTPPPLPCPCTDPAMCKPLSPQPPLSRDEVVAFSSWVFNADHPSTVRDRHNYTAPLNFDWSKITTYAPFDR